MAKHTLTLIGFISGYTAHLDLDEQAIPDAVAKWREEYQDEPEVIRFEFDDTFSCYAAYPTNPTD